MNNFGEMKEMKREKRHGKKEKIFQFLFILKCYNFPLFTNENVQFFMKMI